MDSLSNAIAIYEDCPMLTDTLETEDRPSEISYSIAFENRLKAFRAEIPVTDSPPPTKGKNLHHRTSRDAHTWNPAPAPFDKEYQSRKAALLHVRSFTGYKWKQENQSANKVSVRLICHTHLACQSRIRVSEQTNIDPDARENVSWHIVVAMPNNRLAKNTYYEWASHDGSGLTCSHFFVMLI